MKSLEKPNLLFDQVFDDCVANMQEPRKGSLQAAKSVLRSKDSDYDAKAQTSLLYTFSRHTSVTANVEKADMVYLYDRKLLKEGRHHYDLLKNSAPHNTCPFCSQRKVRSLDHYLPKTLYPSFSISPMNLVPCCSDCNKDKDTIDASTIEDQLIHPYYDDLGDVIWLGAEVIELEPVAIVFKVNDFSSTDMVLHARVTNHFDLLGLGDLYSSHAAEELQNISGTLASLENAYDENLVERFLRLQYNGCFSNSPNSWKTAFYRSLLDSQWFQTLVR